MWPLVSAMIEQGLVEPRTVPQTRVFEAAVLFARSEGIVPAPETAHAIAAVADLARSEHGERCIVFNLSGHGLLDLGSYEKYLDRELIDYEHPAREIDTALAALPEM